MRIIQCLMAASFLSGIVALTAQAASIDTATSPAVAPQYDTTHVYLAPPDVDRFIVSFLATFGGTSTKKVMVTVTPTPSVTSSQLLLTPVGSLSIFGFRTPVPYPFGSERTGYLVHDMNAAVNEARADGAGILVYTFPDAIGRDAVIQWPGGVNMQLYWHFKTSTYAPLQSIPENRVYLSPDKVSEFVSDFSRFSRGVVVADDASAPGIEIGRPGDTYRRIRITSPFGKMTVLVTDGHLPFPYGREITGYAVDDLSRTIVKAKAAGAAIVAGPYSANGREAAMLEFPGGYIAEVHSGAP